MRGTVAELAAPAQPLLGARLRDQRRRCRAAPACPPRPRSRSRCAWRCSSSARARRSETAASCAAGRSSSRACARASRTSGSGAHTGLLDQLASLCGARDAALLIDFRSLEVERVPLRARTAGASSCSTPASATAHASSGYNERRAECARACELLGVGSLREAAAERARASCPSRSQRRARHVLGENERVRAAVARAARRTTCPRSARCSTPRTRACATATRSRRPPSRRPSSGCCDAGAAGARLVGGGFGGSVLGLFAPGAQPPAGARSRCAPGPGAHLLGGLTALSSARARTQRARESRRRPATAPRALRRAAPAAAPA